MSHLLTEAQWRALRQLYIAGRAGIPYDGRGYGKAGPWPVLRQLRDRQPPLVREVWRPQSEIQNLMVITEAGVTFYEANERLYDAFYPSTAPGRESS
ncbi:MAG: hypothetical protein GX573_05905 [Chloroflexi bacterium]|nr:hypothetical protein [Chloroflexota bacterium]